MQIERYKFEYNVHIKSRLFEVIVVEAVLGISQANDYKCSQLINNDIGYEDKYWKKKNNNL